MANGEYPHLLVPSIIQGNAKLTGGGRQNPEVRQNRENHETHARGVQQSYRMAQNYYARIRDERPEELPDLPANTPFLLRIPDDADPEFILSLGIEIVAETPDGIILVSTDTISAEKFEDKIRRFEALQHGGGSIAKVLEVISIESIDDRLSRVLSPQLLASFQTIGDDQEFVADIGIECQGTVQLPKYPTKSSDDEGDRFERRVLRWRARYDNARDEIENLQIEREQQLIDFVEAYGGEVISITQEIQDYILPDSFTVRAEIPGSALKDLALNFPFVFDIQEAEDTSFPMVGDELAEFDFDFQTTSPVEDAPILAIVDSGMQEGHPMLEFAVTDDSFCLVPDLNDDDTADYVIPSGHGTRVAGAALYHRGIPQPGTAFQAPFWLRNIRVLDSNNLIRDNLFPPAMVKRAVDLCISNGRRSRILNASINATQPCRRTYMTAWAAAVDDISHKHDVLIVSSAGNLPDDSHASRLGVLSALNGDKQYPAYLAEPGSRIANPAQSFQTLTVGAVSIGEFSDDDHASIASEDQPASYSAAGFGIWGSIKPEVVAPVGDVVVSHEKPYDSRIEPDITISLPRSTLHGGPLCDRDTLGTSFAAALVSGLAAEIQASYPGLSALTYKSIIASSASWPDWVDAESREIAIRTLGYGVVDSEKALGNASNRVCLVQDGDQSIRQRQTHLYKIVIPEEIRAPENDVMIRVSVTMSYSSQPRRTRRSIKRYYSAWVDWKSSRRSESFDSLAARACKEADDDIDGSNDGAFPWTIGHAANYGVLGVTRSNSACQKDWFDVPAFELPSEFGIAVTCHPGWDTNPDSDARYSLVVAIEALDQEMPIYTPIRVALDELVAEAQAEVELQVSD